MCTHYTEQAEIQYLLAWLLPSNWWMAWPQSWLHRKFHLFPSTPADGIATHAAHGWKNIPQMRKLPLAEGVVNGNTMLATAQSESVGATSQQPGWAEESNGEFLDLFNYLRFISFTLREKSLLCSELIYWRMEIRSWQMIYSFILTFKKTQKTTAALSSHILLFFSAR